jgi:hypothetical protein
MQPDEDSENLRHKCIFNYSIFMNLISIDGFFINQGIHTYTINERLFAVPTYVGDNGESICPVCKSSRKAPTSFSPQFCK